MKKKIILAIVLACVGIISYFESSETKTASSMILQSGVEALSTCELPDGYRANGHCVSNDRGQYFCSNEKGSKDCFQ